jgi:glutathione S-transferase
MKLFGHPMSTCTRKVLTTLAEKNYAADFVMVDFAKREHKAAEHIARQPFGVIPALEDEGLEMYESRAICRYLDKKLPGVSLTPTDLKTYARMEQWISVEQSYFTPAAMKIIYQRVLIPMAGGQGDESIVDAGRVDLKHAISVLDKALEGKTYLCGDQFTIADICFMPYCEYIFAAREGETISAKNFGSWWGRVSERASWRKATGK